MASEIMRVKSSRGAYPVTMCESVEDAMSGYPGSFCLMDNNIARLYGTVPPVAAFRSILRIDANERAKEYHRVGYIIETLLAAGIRKSNHLVVIGGGVIQDVGCFAASILFRGIKWTFVPTTLLAMADSCIGSKSSINMGTKNQLGTFWPPDQVRIAPEFLGTLSDTDQRSGWGEIIKLQLLDGNASFAELRSELQSGKRDAAKWIDRSLCVKQRFIEDDEFDTGARRLLNYGHTLGHAYEAATDYRIPHGIAVILGIIGAANIAQHIGELSRARTEQLVSFLRDQCGGYAEMADAVDVNELITATRADKKAVADGVNMVLLTNGGFRIRPVSFHEMEAALRSEAGQ